MKAICAAQVEERDLGKALNEFLVAYCTTTHQGKTPSELLFNCEVSWKLPTLRKVVMTDLEVRDHDVEYKQQMKDHADN